MDVACGTGARAAVRPLSRLLFAGLLVVGVVIGTSQADAASLSVTWNAPTTNADGSALADLAGYRIYLGTSTPACPGSSFLSVDSPTSAPQAGETASASVTSLVAGTTYFARVTAIDTSGNESGCSPTASGVAQGDFSVAPGTTTSFGSVTTGTTVDRTFTVQNTSAGSIAGSVSVGAPFSIVSGGAFSLSAGDSQAVTVRFAPTVAGTFAANVTFTAAGDTVSRGVSGSATTESGAPAPSPSPNPAPSAGSLAPSSIVAGSGAFTLTVNGNGFVDGSVVRWAGTDRATTFVSATQLRAGIGAADVIAAGSVGVSVFTPAPGGGTSGSLTFTIASAATAPAMPPNPSVTLLSLDSSGATFLVAWSAVSGVTSYRYVAAYNDGTSAQSGSVNGLLSFQLRMPYPASGEASSAYVCIVSVNAAGLQSADQSCSAFATPARSSTPSVPPVPGAGSLSPASAVAGSGAFSLTVNGSGFVATSVVRWNGANRTTTVVSATQLRASITAADVSTARSVPVTVFTPAPGGGTSGAVTFTVTTAPPAVPVASSLSPASATAGGAAFTLTVNGSRFATSSVVRWAGADRTTTFVSATQLRASISAADIGGAGSVTVSVFTPAPGGGTSANLTFTVTPPVPAAGSLSPASATAGGAAFTLTVNGGGFVTSSVVRWNGANRATTFVSAGQLRASVSAADIASARTVSVTVFTPAPGGGTSAGMPFSVTPSLAPVPVAGSLSPASATAGKAAFTLTVNGSGFVTSSVVRWNGANRTTTFVSAGQLRASISAADIASARTVPVSVFTPTPGGGTSASLTFTVAAATAPAPLSTPGVPSTMLIGADGSGVTFTIWWGGVSGATSYRYRALFSDGTGLRQGTVTAPHVDLQMPYHASTLAVPAVICVTAVNAAGQASAEVCGVLPMPARY